GGPALDRGLHARADGGRGRPGYREHRGRELARGRRPRRGSGGEGRRAALPGQARRTQPRRRPRRGRRRGHRTPRRSLSPDLPGSSEVVYGLGRAALASRALSPPDFRSGHQARGPRSSTVLPRSARIRSTTSPTTLLGVEAPAVRPTVTVPAGSHSAVSVSAAWGRIGRWRIAVPTSRSAPLMW